MIALLAVAAVGALVGLGAVALWEAGSTPAPFEQTSHVRALDRPYDWAKEPDL